MGTRRRSFRPLILFWVAGFTLAAASSVVPVRASSSSSILSRFFSRPDEPLRDYRAYRHLHAVNERFSQEAWLDAWTEVKNGRFSYRVISEKGSEIVRKRVRAVLAGESPELACRASYRRCPLVCYGAPGRCDWLRW